jgi:amino-acid N-acetyltransferase
MPRKHENPLPPFSKGGEGIRKKIGMIRKAKLRDIKEIQRLIKLYSTRGGILPRSLSELYDYIRDFFVFIRNRKIEGICALHICWDDLAEIRSLAVQEEVFALTYQPDFFERIGFKRVDKTVLPHKIWTDCLKCIKFPDCDEVALVKELD